MTEWRAKKLEKIAGKTMTLIEELNLLTEAEMQHINEYDACEDVCRNLTDAEQMLRRAMYARQQAQAAAELEDMKDQMQQNLDSMAG